MSSSLLKVDLDVTKNEKGQIEVNGNNRNSILNGWSIGLTCYESVCKPREITNNANLSISTSQIERIIKEILTCSICYEIYQDPVNMKSCLHKFCKKCIEDYNRKFKKECAICRHPVETRRLMKEDTKFNDIIKCLIPDVEKYKEEEEKAMNCAFKDEEKMKHQLEQANKIEESEIKNYKFNNSSNSQSNVHSNTHHREPKGNVSSHNGLESSKHNNTAQEEKSSNEIIGRKTHRDVSSAIIDSFNKKNNIVVKLFCDDNEENLKNYFQKTQIFLEDSYTLEFISRYICYKQNFKCEQIKKIVFYTINNDKSKKYWDQSRPLKELVSYENKHNSQSENNPNNTNIPSNDEHQNEQGKLNEIVLYFLRS